VATRVSGEKQIQSEQVIILRLACWD